MSYDYIPVAYLASIGLTNARTQYHSNMNISEVVPQVVLEAVWHDLMSRKLPRTFFIMHIGGPCSHK